MMKGVNYRGFVTGKAVDREGAGKKIKTKESNDISNVSEQKVCKIKCVMMMMVSMLLNVSILIFLCLHITLDWIISTNHLEQIFDDWWSLLHKCQHYN